MTLASATSRNDYIGNGSVATYSYTFRVLEDTDLLVTTRDLTGLEVTLSLNTGYTVTGVGNGSGGTITLTDGNLTSGYSLTIRRVRPLTQETDIRNQGAFYPETHEDAFDHQVMLAQQQQDELNRSIRLPETEDGGSVELVLPDATARASKVLGFDGSGNVTVLSALPTASVSISPFAETLLDDASASIARETLGIDVQKGTTAARPSFGNAGRFYVNTTTNTLQRDSGSAWEDVGTVADLGVTTAKLADDSVTSDKLADHATVDASRAVTTDHIRDAAVTAAKIAASIAGNGLSGGGGTALSVNVDSSTIEINSDTLRVKDAGITEAKLASAVTTKLGQNIGLVSRVSSSNSTASYVDAVNYSGQGRLLGVAFVGTGNGTTVEVILDGTTFYSASGLGTSTSHIVWNDGNSTTMFKADTSGYGNLSEISAFFKTSLQVRHKQTSTPGQTADVYVAYERQA